MIHIRTAKKDTASLIAAEAPDCLSRPNKKPENLKGKNSHRNQVFMSLFLDHSHIYDRDT